MPQPVGTKARMHAKISTRERDVAATATARPTNTSKNERLWIRRSTNWKFTEAFWLKVNT